jgi:hypothetical protein
MKRAAAPPTQTTSAKKRKVDIVAAVQADHTYSCHNTMNRNFKKKITSPLTQGKSLLLFPKNIESSKKQLVICKYVKR